ncbi:hypothetical protein [Halomonas sp. DWK9]|uniref:hypothetical protein n=1 Tax=Halomonas sp. DWK9 TaxID=3060155 RepID=UPI00287F89D1|nr:hypothetical protein [Halomonas sp. DWK9]
MSFEQAVVRLEQTNATLQEEVVRFRDAVMGLSNIYPTITEGRQNTADGRYFSVPGSGAYMRLYRRSGSSASLIAEFPDRAELLALQSQMSGLLSRGVSAGYLSMGSASALLRVSDGIYAARSDFGRYLSPSTSATDNDIDEALPGECGLYAASLPGVFPYSPNDTTTFFWIETQKTYSGASVVQTAYPYTSSISVLNLVARKWTRMASNNRNAEGRRVWGPWVEEFNNHNILGTVSHSGGFTNGAIIEQGSTTGGGRYRKLADGTMESWITTEFTDVGIFGSGTFADPYRSGSRNWDFPQQFVVPPEISYYCSCDSVLATERANMISGRTISTSRLGAFQVYRTTNALGEQLPVKVTLTASGRWRN